MLVLTAAQSREADRLAIETLGIPAETLMDNAARGVVASLKKNLPGLSSSKVLIVAGKGNNGGDGRVVARLLQGAAAEVRVAEAAEVAERPALVKEANVVVDALFGTGLSRPVEGADKAAIEAINRHAEWVIAIDIPSGLSGDSGKPLGASVEADVTVTMGRPKTGLILPEAASYVGRLEIADIGIPQKIYDGLGGRLHWVVSEDLRPWFPPRRLETHKGTYGHVLLIGGSENKPGAILLSGKAALRTGSGLATVALPDKAFRKFPKNFLELMYEPLPSVRSGTLSRKAWGKLAKVAEGKSALAMGPGMGVNADTKALVKNVVLKTSAPLVLDADGLNAVNAADLKKRRSPAILTPHPGEMARLVGSSPAKVQQDRIGVARAFAEKYGVILILKGFRTVVALPAGEVFVNSTGNPGMATAGMGDVMTGVIVSLLGQGLPPEKAAIAGVYLHGRAGDRVAGRLGDRGLLASDVIDEMPLTLRDDL